MICPHCGAQTQVLETRAGRSAVKRRRQCASCGERVTTWETTIRPVRDPKLEQRRARRRAHMAKIRARDPAAYTRQKERWRLRRLAREEAAETGEDVQAIYARWNVG